MTTHPDWSKLRTEFPILDQSVHGYPLVYLDNAATTQKPRSVIDAARHRAAQFIHARSADEIIFTRGTTESINLVAQTWGAAHLRQGDQILLTEMEHHSNIVPWQLLAQRIGARVRYLPVNGDQ